MNTNINIGVFGCTDSTQHVLQKLLEIDYINVKVLVTLSKKEGQKKSRFKKITFHKNKLNIQIFEVPKVNEDELKVHLTGLSLDVILEIGWSLKIPKSILKIPRFGTVGIHNSLLPEFQGPASLNWALIWDYKVWGCTLFHLEENFDEGDIIYQQSFEIDDSDDINTLFSKSDQAASKMILWFLKSLPGKGAPRLIQDKSQISRTRKRVPEDSLIDWRDTTRAIFNLIRATKRPYPNAFSFINGEKILINGAVKVIGIKGIPGTILSISENNILVATGNGAICLSEYVFESGNSYVLNVGEKFDEEI